MGIEPKSFQLLLIDDDRELGQMLVDYLAPDNIELIACSSGEAGLEILAGQAFDLLILDIMLPGMNGLDVLIRLRKHAITKDIPVIMQSASLRDRDQALKEGARYFFQKPCPPGIILTALGDVTDESITSGAE